MRTLPDSIVQLYDHAGPFVTVYLDATRDTENGAHEVELRWQELRRQLSEDGAAGADVEAVDAALRDVPGFGGRYGRVLVAADGDVRLDETLPAASVRPRATLAALPDLVPLLAGEFAPVSYVLVVADRSGADIVAVPGDLAAAGLRPEAATVQGSRQYPLHRTGRDEWHERHFQNRVENSWATNAEDVAAEVGARATEVGAELVVVAGDPRARGLLRDDLPAVLDPSVELVAVEAGARADGSSPESLDEALRAVLLRYTWRQRRDVFARLQQNLGRKRYAVAGVPAVLDAVRRSQADTVVLSDDPSSTLPAWIGPEPLQLGRSEEELAAMGVDRPRRVRFDAALVRAVVGSGADLVVTPNAHDYVTDGIAALLRYDDAATRT